MSLQVTIPAHLAGDLEKLAWATGVSAETLALSLLSSEIHTFKKLSKEGDLRKFRPK